MQSADDPASLEATKLLHDGGSCLFDVSKKGAQLLLICFGSQCCTDMDTNTTLSLARLHVVDGPSGRIGRIYGAHISIDL